MICRAEIQFAAAAFPFRKLKTEISVFAEGLSSLRIGSAVEEFVESRDAIGMTWFGPWLRAEMGTHCCEGSNVENYGSGVVGGQVPTYVSCSSEIPSALRCWQYSCSG